MSYAVQRTVLPLALVALFLLAGCDRKPKAGARPVPEVSTVTIAPQNVVLSTELSGRTSSFRIAEIRPRINGLIQRRLFTEGSDVKADQVLYQIDPAPFQAELDTAAAALAQAVAKLPATRSRAERYRQLLTDSALSQQDYDDAASSLNELKANIVSLQARVETARINLGYTKVTAPISGRIGKSNVTDGAIVTAYQATPLATIQQLNPIYVDVPQSTSELLDLKARFAAGVLNPHMATAQGPVLYAFSIFVIFLCVAALYESWTIPIVNMMPPPMPTRLETVPMMPPAVARPTGPGSCRDGLGLMLSSIWMET